MAKPALVEVVWCDSFLFDPSWYDVDDLPEATIVHRAVGYVVSENKASDDEPTVLMLAAAISDDGSRAAGIVAIPHPTIFFRKQHEPLEWRGDASESPPLCDQIVNNGFGEPTECGRTLPCPFHRWPFGDASESPPTCSECNQGPPPLHRAGCSRNVATKRWGDASESGQPPAGHVPGCDGNCANLPGSMQCFA